MQMVDRDERKAPRPRDRLRGRDADEERADEARPARDRHRVDSVQRRAGLDERLLDHRRDELEMPARRDLRHDASVARVEIGLGGDDVREDPPVLRDDRSRSLVAGRLEP